MYVLYVNVYSNSYGVLYDCMLIVYSVQEYRLVMYPMRHGHAAWCLLAGGATTVARPRRPNIQYTDA